MSSVLDINGQEIRKGGVAMLLCEVLDVEEHAVQVRVMNSDTVLAVGTKHDEVLGGIVADSELTAFLETPVQNAVEADPVKISAFE